MKKLLLSLVVILVATASANAQACAPDPQFTDPGIYPDSATGLTPACADQPYTQLITNVVPADTLVDLPIIGPTPIPIDSVVITSWTGLPPGFTYACYDGGNTISPTDGCAYEGGTTGCAIITGNPTMADIGSYQQIIEVFASAGNGLETSTETIDYYYIHIIDCTNSLETLSDSKFLVYPNPAKEMITLNGLNDIEVESVVITNMGGQQMAYFADINTPALDMDLNHFESGMYFVTINYNGVSEVIKFIKE
jgi:hypothetical protein